MGIKTTGFTQLAITRAFKKNGSLGLKYATTLKRSRSMSARVLPLIPKIGDNGTGSALDSGVDENEVEANTLARVFLFGALT